MRKSGVLVLASLTLPGAGGAAAPLPQRGPDVLSTGSKSREKNLVLIFQSHLKNSATCCCA